MAMNMVVGDIVEIKSNQRVPADMVILATDDP
jgi:magnesium-transporting ATPase (P-type)